MNLNKCFILGRVTRDPELKATPSSQQVATFSIATNKKWKDKNGDMQEMVEFHNIVFWGKSAETIAQYVKKGSLLLVEGRLQTRNWDSKDGQKKNRTEIVADNMIMLDGGKMSTGGTPSNNASTPNMDSSNQAPPLEELPTIQQDVGEDISVEDIPF